jgi:hypothetical protein
LLSLKALKQKWYVLAWLGLLASNTSLLAEFILATEAVLVYLLILLD